MGNNDNAVKYMRSKFSKEVLNNYYNIGNLNKEAQELLKSKTKNLKLSVDSLTKNIIKHTDLKFSDYSKISEILRKPDLIKKDGNFHIKLFKNVDEKLYEIVIKTTKNREEVFLNSIHISNLKRMHK